MKRKVLKRFLYIIYLIEWCIVHSDAGFRDCRPVCFAEWEDCELADMIKHPEYYQTNWYHFIIKYVSPDRCVYRKEIPVEPLILEPEDWSKKEWKVILDLFGMKSAKRIVVSDFVLETFGDSKTED